ncbi:MAG: adenylate/guanylate cyclase domain-containing protein [Spirochaetaceae bacterium]|jgi:adenylate cyclase|nr:adenylate/guanylate cyclase domain-containing protein [Spirochaetaceae bacterium]
MKGNSKKHSKPIAVIFITLVVFLVVVLFHFFGLFDYLEYKTYDLRIRLSAQSHRPADDIVVILLDQASIDWAQRERGWGWPWPRQALGELLDYMHIAQANTVAFDVIFSEPSVYGPEDDTAFVQSARAFGKAVQTVFFSTQSGNVFTWPGDVNKPLFNPLNFDALLPRFSLLTGEENPEIRIGAQFPIRGLLDTAGAVGNVAGTADSDDVFRGMDLFTLFDGKAVPGLSAASLLAAGADRDISYNKKAKVIEWGDYTIPVDKNGRTLLRFRGSLDRYIPYSIADILQSAGVYRQGGTPLYPPEDFSGKYVFFGYYAPGLFDICTTPISSVYPGMGMHITMLDNILTKDFISEIPPWLSVLIIAGMIILITLLVSYSGRIPLSLGGTILSLGALIAVGFFAFVRGFWMPVIAPVSGGLAAFLTATLYNYATEGSQKRFIKSAFSQYLSPTVIEQLLANPGLLSLGGERREISIFFSDVQGFTTISEKLDPAQLTELLNDYLSFMTDTILDSGGTIDKYEGDAIIAFWNAPLNFEDHAARALSASMLCQQKLAERQDFFNEKYGCRLLTRIGLNTGYAVVGNMGSSKRFDYTMLGDSVNLAARLEGLNKQFGTYLMCTETTFNHAVKIGPFFGRKLAQVAVVGKKEAVTVYEPMAEAVFREKEPVLRKFDTARDLFYQGSFTAALPLFEALIEQDKPAFFYADQCRYYLKNPGDWKGFWQAASK